MLSRDSEPVALSRFDVLRLDLLSPEAAPSVEKTRLIRVPLAPQDGVLLPLEQLTEIISVESIEVLPIPEMPACVLGIGSWRGEMLWLVDFNQFVGYSSSIGSESFSETLTVLVIQSTAPQAITSKWQLMSVGIVVSQVQEIEQYDLQQLQSPAIGMFSPDLLPLVRGILPGCDDPVLDLEALIQCPRWKQHSTTQQYEHFPD